MDVYCVCTRVNLTVGTFQKVVTEVITRRILAGLKVNRLCWSWHMFANPALTTQSCSRCTVIQENSKRSGAFWLQQNMNSVPIELRSQFISLWFQISHFSKKSQWFDWNLKYSPWWYIIKCPQHRGKWVREWLKVMAFLGTADNEVHIVHISHTFTACTLESLSSLTQITHNLQDTTNFKKREFKKEQHKSEDTH